MKSTDYTPIAPTYDARYAANPLSGIKGALLAVATHVRAKHVLEVGCGTGHWLAELKLVATDLYGIDPSHEMLAKARERDAALNLACGRDTDLRFPDAFFDMVFCVNAIHHFDAPQRFGSTGIACFVGAALSPSSVAIPATVSTGSTITSRELARRTSFASPRERESGDGCMMQASSA
jgi:SAM-dependent methyltransferase